MGLRHHGDDGAAVGPAFDKAHGAQLAKRLAHRRAGDIEAHASDASSSLSPGRSSAGDDTVGDGANHLVDGGARPNAIPLLFHACPLPGIAISSDPASSLKPKILGE